MKEIRANTEMIVCARWSKVEVVYALSGRLQGRFLHGESMVKRGKRRGTL